MSKKFKTRCIVPNCNSGKLVKFNRFPKNAKQCQRWLQVVKNPFLETLTLKEIQTYRVCQLHFSKDDFFVTAERPRLKWDAVPSLHLPFEQISSKERKIDLQNDPNNKNKNSIQRIRPKFVKTPFSISYDESNKLPEDEIPMEQEHFRESCLFQEEISPVENILSCASKEFQRAEKGKEITIAFKIRARLYEHINVENIASKKPKNYSKKMPSKENREIKIMSCIVPNCKSGRCITKHCFPKDKYIGRKWVKAVKSPFLKGMSYEEIWKKKFHVCYLHFPHDSWRGTIKPRLKSDAVPSLKLPKKLIRKEDMVPKEPIDLPVTQAEVNLKIDLYSTITPLLPKICDFSPESTCVRESSFELVKNEDLNIKYRSINDIGMLPFDTKYSQEAGT